VCSNNLHTIGIGCYNYADTYGNLPQGTSPLGNDPPEKRLSWQVALLPFIEQDAAYTAIDLEQPWDAPRNQEAVVHHIKTYLCPAGPYVSEPGHPAITHYIGMAGVGPDAVTLPKDSARAGVFGYDRTVALKDITDGTMNTILALESFGDNGGWAEGGPATVRGVDLDNQPYVGISRPFGGLHAQRSWFGTMPTSANAAFADGSVRQLHHTISAQTFEALATIAGGEQIPGEY
jgi:prepilin-type processing-associated H-X9-DG protein